MFECHPLKVTLFESYPQKVVFVEGYPQKNWKVTELPTERCFRFNVTHTKAFSISACESPTENRNCLRIPTKVGFFEKERQRLAACYPYIKLCLNFLEVQVQTVDSNQKWADPEFCGRMFLYSSRLKGGVQSARYLYTRQRPKIEKSGVILLKGGVVEFDICHVFRPWIRCRYRL